MINNCNTDEALLEFHKIPHKCCIMGMPKLCEKGPSLQLESSLLPGFRLRKLVRRRPINSGRVLAHNTPIPENQNVAGAPMAKRDSTCSRGLRSDVIADDDHGASRRPPAIGISGPPQSGAGRPGQPYRATSRS